MESDERGAILGRDEAPPWVGIMGASQTGLLQGLHLGGALGEGGGHAILTTALRLMGGWRAGTKERHQGVRWVLCLYVIVTPSRGPWRLARRQADLKRPLLKFTLSVLSLH